MPLKISLTVRNRIFLSECLFGHSFALWAPSLVLTRMKKWRGQSSRNEITDLRLHRFGGRTSGNLLFTPKDVTYLLLQSTSDVHSFPWGKERESVVTLTQLEAERSKKLVKAM
jgi:hypothetical protein